MTTLAPTDSYNNMLLQVYKSLDWIDMIHALILIIAGFMLAHLARSTVLKLYQLNSSGKYSRFIGKFTYYIILFIFVVSAIRTLGFDLQILLGATGILTVALGFASQTSISNLISGLFLVAERSFVVGDTLNVNGSIGEVLAVDLLSVKLRQADNTMVRIPNEVMIKTQFINVSRFPTRRFDCVLSVSTHSDVALIRILLLALANDDPLCLQNPGPILEIKEITDSALRLQFSVWCIQKNFITVKNAIQEKLLKVLYENGIMVSSSNTVIELSSFNKPLPIALIQTQQQTNSTNLDNSAKVES
jgi:small-conductance mechanosensitive channel